jgi:hypothetical protein
MAKKPDVKLCTMSQHNAFNISSQHMSFEFDRRKSHRRVLSDVCDSDHPKKKVKHDPYVLPNIVTLHLLISTLQQYRHKRRRETEATRDI